MSKRISYIYVNIFCYGFWEKFLEFLVRDSFSLRIIVCREFRVEFFVKDLVYL